MNWARQFFAKVWKLTQPPGKAKLNALANDRVLEFDADMTESLRTFIAVEITLPLNLRMLVENIREMGQGVKVVASASTHITLKFLGDTPVESLPSLTKILQSVAGEFPGFDVDLVGIGAFPHWRRPQVIWVGVQPELSLKNIADRLETELDKLGFPKERRDYEPHLTLARIKAKPPKELKELASRYEGTHFGTQSIDRIIFYQSELQPTGPVYTPLATILLKEASFDG